MPKTFLVSDESVNSYKCRVLSEGGDTSAFESNPVMLYMHLRGNVIGKWENLRLEDGNWYADPVFDTEDTKPGGGAEIGGKVEREFIKAASMGIVILDLFYNEELKCYDITKWALQEISIVDIGSNSNALQLYNQAGEPIDELKLSAHLEQFKPTTQSTQSIPLMKQIALSALALAMGLAEDAGEDQVLMLARQGQTAIGELTKLRKELADNQTKEATTLVDQAVADHRIPATAKDAYLKLFASDHESARDVLAGLVKPQNLVTLANQGAVHGATQIALLDKADKIKKYDELDKSGTLLQLAKSDYPGFESLYEAKFNCKPDKLKV